MGFLDFSPKAAKGTICTKMQFIVHMANFDPDRPLNDLPDLPLPNLDTEQADPAMREILVC